MSRTIHTVLLIGGGEIGQAFSHLLQMNHDLAVSVWDKNPQRSSTLIPQKDLVAAADVIIVCVPSVALRVAVTSMRRYLRPETIVLTCAKGIEPRTGYTVDQVLRELLPNKQPLGVIGGPLIAEEIMQGSYGYPLIACASPTIAKVILAVWKKSLVHVATTVDVRGVALAGVLKNVYAISLGIVDELHWSKNERGWLLTTSMQEMAAIMSRLGGRASTAYSVAGLGDLFATGTSEHSSNYRFGRALAGFDGDKPWCEGASSLPVLVKRLHNKTSGFPVLHALVKVIIKKYTAFTVFDNLRTEQK